MLWRSFGSQWSSESTVLNSNIFLLSNVYNSIIIAVDYFVAYWLLAASIQELSMQLEF